MRKVKAVSRRMKSRTEVILYFAATGRTTKEKASKPKMRKAAAALRQTSAWAVEKRRG